MASESGLKKKVKSKNWTEEETETLMEAHGARRAVLEGRLGANLTFHEKKRAWEAVVEAVNAVGHQQRTAEQVKKRWENLVTAARKTIMEWEREKVKTGKRRAILDFN